MLFEELGHSRGHGDSLPGTGHLEPRVQVKGHIHVQALRRPWRHDGAIARRLSTGSLAPP